MSMIAAAAGIFSTRDPLSQPAFCHSTKLSPQAFTGLGTLPGSPSPSSVAAVFLRHSPVQSPYSRLKRYPLAQLRQSVGLLASTLHSSQCHAALQVFVLSAHFFEGGGGGGPAPSHTTCSWVGSPDGVIKTLLAYCMLVEDCGLTSSHVPLYGLSAMMHVLLNLHLAINPIRISQQLGNVSLATTDNKQRAKPHG